MYPLASPVLLNGKKDGDLQPYCLLPAYVARMQIYKVILHDGPEVNEAKDINPSQSLAWLFTQINLLGASCLGAPMKGHLGDWNPRQLSWQFWLPTIEHNHLEEQVNSTTDNGSAW